MNIVEGPRKEFVLVVDSDDYRGRSLVSELRSLGCYVSLARSGAEAVTYVNENEPDSVVLDWDLRDIRGLDLARHLSVRSRKPRIILLKHEPDWRSLRNALESGGDDLLARPMSTGALSRVIARPLDGDRRSRRVPPPRPMKIGGDLELAGGVR
jgi:DNA-binding response OmpR family regulator